MQFKRQEKSGSGRKRVKKSAEKAVAFISPKQFLLCPCAGARIELVEVWQKTFSAQPFPNFYLLISNCRISNLRI
jgi:hypothetical protein